MVDIALASVVTSGVVGLGGLAAALWSTRENGRLTREGRVQERRIDAYLEILRLIEHQSLWFETRYRRAKVQGDPFERMPSLPPKPEPGERATIAALLAAFGSERLKTACEDWRYEATELDQQFEVAEWNWRENGGDPDSSTDPKDLVLLESQLAALTAETGRIELVIATEIGQMQIGALD